MKIDKTMTINELRGLCWERLRRGPDPAPDFSVKLSISQAKFNEMFDLLIASEFDAMAKEITRLKDKIIKMLIDEEDDGR